MRGIMIYPYKCPTCNKYIEIFKYSKDASREEYCDDCDTVLNRIYTSCYTNIPFKEHFNRGLNTYVRSKHHLNNTLGEIERNTGNKLVNIGNDKLPRKKHVAAKITERELQKVVRKLDI